MVPPPQTEPEAPLRACELAGVAPAFKHVEAADPVGYVLGLNLYRRHLDKSQRAMVGARAGTLREKLAAEAKERMRLSQGRGQKGQVAPPDLNSAAHPRGQTRELLGAAVGVGGSLIDKATKVLKHGTPELIDAVDRGHLKVYPAAEIAEEEPERQREEVVRAQTASPRPKPEPAPADETEVRRRPTKAVAQANEAINCLIRIPKNDPQRKRGFQIVTDWIRRNQ